MDHLPNVFKNFDNLYQINVTQVQSRLTFSMPLVVIENYIANRLLFPYAVPLSKQESQLEYAILGAIVTLNSGYFYNQALQRITIPAEYNLIYQDINLLILTVIQNVNLNISATIEIPNLTGRNTTGMAIAIKSPGNSQIVYDNQSYTLESGKTLHLPPKSIGVISINHTDTTIASGQLGIYLISIKP